MEQISRDEERMVNGKSMKEWIRRYPVLSDISEGRETCWKNSGKLPFEKARTDCPLSMADIQDAEKRLERFAAYIRIAFPETEKNAGIIESPLREIRAMKQCLEKEYDVQIPGRLMVKLDSSLPVSGSIKARGGIYEVLKTAEDIALKEGILKPGDSYEKFATEEFRNIFSGYSIAVGSTGNLGLSIGIMSAKLGFKVTVHMSADARQWKKDLLRSRGVTVIEYEQDYSIAVKKGREEASKDPSCHFVDDENSKTLFLGYSVAALRLKKQLDALKIAVDVSHPLFVYLPCGVGGGPGGVSFGLKQVFGDGVHCFFAEPTHSCCMMLGMVTGLQNQVSVQDFGLDNRTCADGLAVGRASGFVGKTMAPFMSGCYSVEDGRLFRFLRELADTEQIFLEPSALAGMYGPVLISRSGGIGDYIKSEELEKAVKNGTHLVWATGGSMVPPEEMRHYYEDAVCF